MKKQKICLRKQGFTLVEMLIVVGIMSLIITIIIILISPSQIQKRARDTARMNDLILLASLVESAITEGKYGEFAVSANSDDIAVTGNSQACGVGNWLARDATSLDLCSYLDDIPVDPLNNKSITIISGPGTTQTFSQAGYGFVLNGGNWVLCSYMEGSSNYTILANDGGKSIYTYEVGPGVEGNSTPDCLPND